MAGESVFALRRRRTLKIAAEEEEEAATGRQRVGSSDKGDCNSC